MNNKELNDDILLVANNDALVYDALKRGCSLTETIMLMHDRHKGMVRRIIELERIAPRKVVVDGEMYVWRCPIDLVPEISLDKAGGLT